MIQELMPPSSGAASNSSSAAAPGVGSGDAGVASTVGAAAGVGVADAPPEQPAAARTSAAAMYSRRMAGIRRRGDVMLSFILH